MCSNKENCNGACSCDDNAFDELFSAVAVERKVFPMTEEKKKEPEKNEDIVEINGVEYVRKNPKQLIEEPVIPDTSDKILITE